MGNRKLDALFESRVLGVTFNASANPFRIMPNYCASLDASWSGMEKVGFSSWSALGDDLDCFGSCNDNPALAVVKLCLFEVGVTQEEIDACD